MECFWVCSLVSANEVLLLLQRRGRRLRGSGTEFARFHLACVMGAFAQSHGHAQPFQLRLRLHGILRHGGFPSLPGAAPRQRPPPLPILSAEVRHARVQPRPPSWRGGVWVRVPRRGGGKGGGDQAAEPQRAAGAQGVDQRGEFVGSGEASQSGAVGRVLC